MDSPIDLSIRRLINGIASESAIPCRSAIMLFLHDRPGGTLLRRSDSDSFLLSFYPIRVRPLLHPTDAVWFAIWPGRFPMVELSSVEAALNPALLLHRLVIDHGCL